MTGLKYDIVILTGAGISAESGLKTFRDSDGLWEGHRVDEVATPEAFEENPTLVYDFYNQRRAQLLHDDVAPNSAHYALAELEQEYDGRVLVVTQNVDDLHERAGSQNVIHMHGQLKSVWCLNCDARMRWADDCDASTECPKCQTMGLMRPDIVWFGEMPYQMEEIYEAIKECKTFVSIGTSGHVYPAAGFVRDARIYGATTIELNLDDSEQSGAFHESRRGKASALVPAWVSEALS